MQILYVQIIFLGRPEIVPESPNPLVKDGWARDLLEALPLVEAVLGLDRLVRCPDHKPPF
jgi:hypothetical protein